MAQGTEFIINMVLLGAAIAIVSMSIIWSKTENLVGMLISILAYLAGIAYFLYMIIIMHIDKKRRWYWASSIESLTIFGCMAILLIFTATIFAIICTVNSQSGLKEHLGKHEEGWDQRSQIKDFELDTNVDFGYKSIQNIRDLDS